MNLQDFNASQIGQDLQEIMDAMSGADGGIAYIKLRTALHQVPEHPASKKLATSISFIAGLLRVLK